MTILLALDTSTEACTAALLVDGRVLSRYEVIPRLHAQRVLPMVQELTAEAGIALSSVDAIAFGRGPGAFTGIRIGVGVVQGLAYALQRPVLPISDLAVIAQRAWREHAASQVCAAIDARMDEVYWGCYRLEGECMALAGIEAVLPPESVGLPRGAEGDWFGAGTGWGYAGRIPVQPARCDANLLPHGEDLLALGLAAFRRGEAVDAQRAQPVYLRDNVAKPKAGL